MLAEVFSGIFNLCVCVQKKSLCLCASIDFRPLISPILRIQSSINNSEQSCILQFLQRRLQIAAVHGVHIRDLTTDFMPRPNL